MNIASAPPADTTATVTLVRTLQASPQQVFAAWTDPDLIRRWLAPAPYRMTIAETDPRVGGRYCIEVTGPEGDRHKTTGEYVELVPGRRLVKTWNYEGPFEANHGETLLIVELREAGPGVTELTLRHERIPNAEQRQSLVQGWTACLDELEGLYAPDRGKAED
jgi:uncharacterized protein YndB with AHSA1/START domain